MRQTPSPGSFTVSATPAPEAAAPAQAAFCPNCGDRLGGRFCSSCGQEARGRDRIRDIAWEWVRGSVGADGILWSTLGALIVDPGRLTRDWWEGRRANRMSPVRVLLTVVLFGSLVAWAEHSLVGRAEADIAILLQVATYQTALVAMVVISAVMPLLLPPSRQRSAYQHVTFALYASTVFGLIACLVMLLIVFGGYAPFWLQDVGLVFAPLAPPLILLAVFVHAVLHVRGAYGVSWIGAVIRIGVLAVCIAVASLIASFVMMASGLNTLWLPDHGA